MFNLVSIIIGVITLAMTLVAFIPPLGFLNWLILPFAILGLGLSVFSSQQTGRNLNLLVVTVGVLRLMLGGGIL